VVTPGQRARLARAKRRRHVQELPDDFESMSGSDQLAWLIDNGVTLAELLGDDGEDEAPAEVRLVTEPQVPSGDPVPEPEMVAPQAVAAKPELPAEPPPPPPPLEWWQERARFRARGPDDYYDDEPEEEDDEEL
jgi:hypothetical protein